MARGRIALLLLVLAVLAIVSTGLLLAVVRGPQPGGARRGLPGEDPGVVKVPARPQPSPPLAPRGPEPSAATLESVTTPAAPPASPEPSVPTAPPPTAPPVTEPSPAPSPTPRPGAAAPAHPGGYAVQVGAFGDRGNAQRLADTIRAAGVDAYVMDPDPGTRVFRVWAGAEPDRGAAQRIADRLQRELGLSGWVTR